MEDLQCEIEYLRKKMHAMALQKGMSHPDVLKISQRLDELINQFYTFDRIQKIDR